MKKIKISAVILALAVAVAFTPSITFAKTNTTLSAPSVRALTNSGSSIQLSCFIPLHPVLSVILLASCI